MNEYLSNKSNPSSICFCFVDNTFRYESGWTKELIKNQSDYTISNVIEKGYDLYQGQNEDVLLNYASMRGYSHAVVFSTGTEFINGNSFFNYVNKLIETEFFIAGHILDRKESHYELHHQCYVINLDLYLKLDKPAVGQQEFGVRYMAIEPKRSEDNYHDDYTPTWVVSSDVEKGYIHRCHGWNLINLALKNCYNITPFDDDARKSKKHFYPENQKEFLKHVKWAHARLDYCANTFVHKSHTDKLDVNGIDFEQVIVPASGLSFLHKIDVEKPVKIVMYDYNQAALDYWSKNSPRHPNITYEFIKINLLTDDLSPLIKDTELKTFINVSNIFCYEGTAMFYSLEFRMMRELELINSVPSNWIIVTSEHSWSGFANNPKKITDLIKPTWHHGEWND